MDPAIRITMALMTNRKSPNVTTVIGMVKMIKSGFTVTFSREMITATMNAVINASRLPPVKAIPGRRYAAMITATEESKSLVNKFMVIMS